jgi:sulfopyruvate decarboxylase beta subunit
MRYAEDELIDILKSSEIDLILSLPCDRIKDLLSLLEKGLPHIPLTREEEGVGISAGVTLAGRRPAIFVQSSGIGNMLNALLSLTVFYNLPLPVFVSHRGIYKEAIAAQVPMGQRLPGILMGAGLSFSFINNRDDLSIIRKHLPDVFANNRVHFFLLNPAVWEKDIQGSRGQFGPVPSGPYYGPRSSEPISSCPSIESIPSPSLTRYEIIELLSPYIEDRAVICNLGIPSKELYNIRHQRSNFYMLGSMGMATPIGIGVAISSKKDVIVIDGDGSLLMNPNSLATAAMLKPDNLTIIAIDNGVYGSTGNQPTFTSRGIDLEHIARAFGIRDTFKVSDRSGIEKAMSITKGLRFIHALAIPGNREVPNIPVHHLDIKRNFQEYLIEDRTY